MNSSLAAPDWITNLQSSSNVFISGSGNPAPSDDEEWSVNYNMFENQGKSFFPYEFNVRNDELILKFTPDEERIIKFTNDDDENNEGTVVVYCNAALPIYLIEGSLPDETFIRLKSNPSTNRISKILEYINEDIRKNEQKTAMWTSLPLSYLGTPLVFKWPEETEYV